MGTVLLAIEYRGRWPSRAGDHEGDGDDLDSGILVYYVHNSIGEDLKVSGDEVKKASLNQTVYHRNYQRARARALARLSRAYQDEYKKLLEEEKAIDEALGKKWVGIDTDSGVPITTGPGSGNQGGTDPSNEGENQGNDGGEA